MVYMTSWLVMQDSEDRNKGIYIQELEVELSYRILSQSLNERANRLRKAEQRCFASGNIIEFTMWDEMAENFNKSILDTLEQPVIVAVSSCRVSKYRDYQLPATPATYHYLNPNIPEADQSQADKKATIINDSYHCMDHGPQPRPGCKYNFMAFITDPPATAPLTFFTPAADDKCNKMLKWKEHCLVYENPLTLLPQEASFSSQVARFMVTCFRAQTSFTVSSLFASSVVRKLGSKNALLLGTTADSDPEGDISLVEKLLNDNSSPRTLDELNSEDIIEFFSAFPIPVEGSDSLLKETNTILSYLDDSLHELETFSFDIEEKNSGSNH
ncbi:nucleic acid-binding, OB-fold protein [Tanacetum coccineum]